MKDLKENGQQIAVTEANKREYVQLACQMKMTESIKSQIKSFLDGFYEIIPKHLISIFNEQELELLISGLPTIDIDDLKANTEYRSYQESSLQVRLSCLSFTPRQEFWAQTDVYWVVFVIYVEFKNSAFSVIRRMSLAEFSKCSSHTYQMLTRVHIYKRLPN